MKKIIIATMVFLTLISLSHCVPAGSGEYGGGHTDPELPWDPSDGNWETSSAGETTTESNNIPMSIVLIIGVVIGMVLTMIILLVGSKKNK